MVVKLRKGKPMPPITQWNPVMVRLMEKVPDLKGLRYRKDIAKTLGVAKSNITDWLLGKEISQKKLTVIANFLSERDYSAHDIVYVMFGHEMSESGAFRLLHPDN